MSPIVISSDEDDVAPCTDIFSDRVPNISCDVLEEKQFNSKDLSLSSSVQVLSSYDASADLFDHEISTPTSSPEKEKHWLSTANSFKSTPSADSKSPIYVSLLDRIRLKSVKS